MSRMIICLECREFFTGRTVCPKCACEKSDTLLKLSHEVGRCISSIKGSNKSQKQRKAVNEYLDNVYYQDDGMKKRQYLSEVFMKKYY